jgi:hypothetical protein
MSYLPQPHRPQRPKRVRPAEYTPAVLRIEDGSCTQGELELFSITGGLLSLPKLLDRGSRAKLMFLTQTGPVLGETELLRPISWTEQPFRFVGLQENDRRRLRSAIQPSSDEPEPERYEIELVNLAQPVKPEPIAKVEPTIRLDQPAPAPVDLASFDPAPFDPEESWIEKYRAAIDQPEPKRRRFPRIFFAALTAATLGLGFLYAFQTHLLR